MDIAEYFEAIRSSDLDEVIQYLDTWPSLVDVVNSDRGIKRIADVLRRPGA